jgi:hypothetical protein
MAALINPAPRHIIGARDGGPLLGYFIDTLGVISEHNGQGPISDSPQLTLHQQKPSFVMPAISSLPQATMVAAMEPNILPQKLN